MADGWLAMGTMVSEYRDLPPKGKSRESWPPSTMVKCSLALVGERRLAVTVVPQGYGSCTARCAEYGVCVPVTA